MNPSRVIDRWIAELGLEARAGRRERRPAREKMAPNLGGRRRAGSGRLAIASSGRALAAVAADASAGKPRRVCTEPRPAG